LGGWILIDIIKTKLSDLVEIERLPFKFPIPDLSDGTYPRQKSIFVNGHLKGFGAAHITSEILLSLSDDIPKLIKARIIRDLFNQFLQQLTKMGILDTHLFIEQDVESLSAILEKHFGFVECTGYPMYFRSVNEQISKPSGI
jgi:hypothetical protein